MKTIEISTASQPLSAYAQEFGEEEELVILTANQQPIAVILPLKQFDAETLALSFSPEFTTLIEQARQEFKAGKTLSLEAMMSLTK
jgi:PHD/YefM family antitoxin component YafN of YafNO toxin-antitoxin module